MGNRCKYLECNYQDHEGCTILYEPDLIEINGKIECTACFSVVLAANAIAERAWVNEGTSGD